MKARGLVLIGVSALLGLAAVTWVKKPTVTGMANVVVAKVALNFGDQLTPAKLSLVDMPPASIPQGAFSVIDDAAAPTPNARTRRWKYRGIPVAALWNAGNRGMNERSFWLKEGCGCPHLPRGRLTHVWSTHMRTFVSRFVKNASGAAAIEYGLIAALISVAIIAAATLVGTNLAAVFTSGSPALTTALG